MSETILAAFKQYDEDQSGSIDIGELQNLIEDLGGKPLDQEELDQALVMLDADKSGQIEQNEFKKWWMSQSSDLDGDGQISGHEHALEQLKLLGQERFHVDIHTAAWNGHLDVVERLLEEPGAASEPDVTEFGERNTPLHYAAYNGNLKVCELLLKKKAPVNALNEAGCSPLFLAAQQDHVQVVSCLIAAGADARIRDKEHGLSALDVASSREMMDAFKQKGGKKPPAPSVPTLSNATHNTIEISWESPPEIGQTIPVSGYKIKLASEGNPPVLSVVKALPTSTKIQGLQSNTSYQAQVASITLNGAGDYSEASEAVETTPPPPQAVMQLEELDIEKDMVELGWTFENDPATAPDYFVVQMIMRKDAPWETVAKPAGDVRTVKVNDLYNGRKYKFRIAAQNPYGLGKFSTPILVQTPETTQRKFQRNANKLKTMRAFLSSGGLSKKAPAAPDVKGSDIRNVFAKTKGHEIAEAKPTEVPAKPSRIPPADVSSSKKTRKLRAMLSQSKAIDTVSIETKSKASDIKPLPLKTIENKPISPKPEGRRKKEQIVKPIPPRDKLQPVRKAAQKTTEKPEAKSPEELKSVPSKPEGRKIKAATKESTGESKSVPSKLEGRKMKEVKPIPNVEAKSSPEAAEDPKLTKRPSRLERVASESKYIDHDDDSDDSADFAYYDSDE